MADRATAYNGSGRGVPIVNWQRQPGLIDGFMEGSLHREKLKALQFENQVMDPLRARQQQLGNVRDQMAIGEQAMHMENQAMAMKNQAEGKDAVFEFQQEFMGLTPEQRFERRGEYLDRANQLKTLHPGAESNSVYDSIADFTINGTIGGYNPAPLSARSEKQAFNGQLSVDDSGNVAPADLRDYMVSRIKDSSLNGMVPRDGAKYGITTGSPEEWSRYFVGLAELESSFNTGTVGDVGRFVGNSNGLYQLSPNDALNHKLQDRPYTLDELKDPTLNADAAIKIHEKLISQDGVISEGKRGAARYWGPLRRGVNPINRQSVSSLPPYIAASPRENEGNALPIESSEPSSALFPGSSEDPSSIPQPQTAQQPSDGYTARLSELRELLPRFTGDKARTAQIQAELQQEMQRPQNFAAQFEPYREFLPTYAKGILDRAKAGGIVSEIDKTLLESAVSKIPATTSTPEPEALPQPTNSEIKDFFNENARAGYKAAMAKRYPDYEPFQQTVETNPDSPDAGEEFISSLR